MDLFETRMVGTLMDRFMFIGKWVECMEAPYETRAAGLLNNDVEFNLR